MLKRKSLLDYTNLFFPNEYENNDKIILKHFQELKRLRWKNYIAWFVVSIENFKNLKYHTSYKKQQFFLLLAVIARIKKKNQLKNIQTNWKKNSWFNWKYIITLKIWLKKTSQEFRFKDIDEIKHYFFDEI